MSKSSAIDSALSALARGDMIILVDSISRENEGDIVCAAEHMTTEKMNFMVTHARGLVCLPMLGEDLDRLAIPLMAQHNASRFQCQFTVSIDAKSGVLTGTSAADRAHTVQIAVDSASSSDDLVMPGHIFPLRCHPEGVLGRKGHTEGSIELMKMAGLKPAAVICEVMTASGAMARLPELQVFSAHHGLPIVSIADITEALTVGQAA